MNTLPPHTSEKSWFETMQSFLKKFNKPELVEEYVRTGLIYYGEIPFLYNAFKPTDIPAPMSKEKGRYRVVSGSRVYCS